MSKGQIDLSSMPSPRWNTRTCTICGAHFTAEPGVYKCIPHRPAKSERGGVLNIKFGQRLSNREKQVHNLIKQGCTSKEIAAALLIGNGTAKVYSNHVYIKLGIKGGREEIRNQIMEDLRTENEKLRQQLGMDPDVMTGHMELVA